MLWIPHRSRGESCGPDETEAKVVLQVFREFADGTALKKIASMLNEKAIPAPNDGGRGNKRGRGWGHTTIRAMLSNERYIGRSTWNQSKWVRVPGRKGRRRVMRPESEWIKHDVPELAIVPPNLWKEVQERFTRACAKGPGRPAGTGQHVHLVSGLMRCGTCGGSMTIVRRKTKAGVAYSNFGCTAHYSRGAAICPNALSISERKASRTPCPRSSSRLRAFVTGITADRTTPIDACENASDASRTSLNHSPRLVGPNPSATNSARKRQCLSAESRPNRDGQGPGAASHPPPEGDRSLPPEPVHAPRHRPRPRPRNPVPLRRPHRDPTNRRPRSPLIGQPGPSTWGSS